MSAPPGSSAIRLARLLRRPGLVRYVGPLLNAALRVSMVLLMVESLVMTDDPRFEGKGIGIRNAVVIGTYSLVFPALHLLRRRSWSRYPWWTDALFLSVPWLDMVGNSLNLYDTWFYFDLVPHTHGPGALTVVLMEAARVPLLSAVGIVQVGHILLEGQEYYTDVLFGTENVRGIFDVVDDLLVGVAGSFAYALAYRWLRVSGPAGDAARR